MALRFARGGWPRIRRDVVRLGFGVGLASFVARVALGPARLHCYDTPCLRRSCVVGRVARMLAYVGVGVWYGRILSSEHIVAHHMAGIEASMGFPWRIPVEMMEK